MSSNTVNGAGAGIINPTAFKTALELENVDNTSDANKPVSTATQAALDLKASLDEDGNLLVGGVVIREITTAQAVTDVPADGEIVSIEGQTVVGDGATVARNLIAYDTIQRWPEITAVFVSDAYTVQWSDLGRVLKLDNPPALQALVFLSSVGKPGDTIMINKIGTNGVLLLVDPPGFIGETGAAVTLLTTAGRYIFQKNPDGTWIVLPQ